MVYLYFDSCLHKFCERDGEWNNEFLGQLINYTMHARGCALATMLYHKIMCVLLTKSVPFSYSLFYHTITSSYLQGLPFHSPVYTTL